MQFQEEMDKLCESLIEKYKRTKNVKAALEEFETGFNELVRARQIKEPTWATKLLFETWKLNFRFKLRFPPSKRKRPLRIKQITSFGQYLIPFSLVVVLTGLWEAETNSFWLVISSLIFLLYFFTVHSYFMSSKSENKFLYLFISIIAPLFLVFKVAKNWPETMSGIAFLISFVGMLFVYYYGRNVNVKIETESELMDKYSSFLYKFLPMLLLAALIHATINFLIQQLGNPPVLDFMVATTSFYPSFCYFFVLSYLSMRILEKSFAIFKRKILKFQKAKTIQN